MKIALLAAIFIALGFNAATEPRVQLLFTPDSAEHTSAAAEYEQIWATEGERIINALENTTGLRFEENKISVIVLEEASSSGYRAIPMRLRASYPLDVKKATLIHELGHRLQAELFKKEDESHPYLFLYLYDVWTQLYGREFADQQVKVESARKGLYDYDRAWKEALALTETQRKERWQNFLASQKRPSSR
jgi:hypothetical protein